MRFVNLLSVLSCAKQLHCRKTFHASLWHAFRQQDWDVIHVEGPLMAGLLPRHFPIPRILSVHDSWRLRCDEILRCTRDFREMAYYRMLKPIEPRYERMAYSHYQHCVVVSHRDRVALEKTMGRPGAVCVIPHGADLDYFKPTAAERQPELLVFHGNLSYSPNVEAALELARVILPGLQRAMPEVKLRLVGANPAATVQALALRSDVTIMANLPDLRHAICSAGVYACPVKHGTGIKNKVLEAMAMQMPIVAYAEAVEGIECTSGEHLLIADSAESFISHAITLVRDREYADRLARAGRLLMERKYSWDARARTYEHLYERVTGEWQKPN